MLPTDSEKNRFSARARRYAKVGSKVGGVAARMAGQRLVGAKPDRAGNARARAATRASDPGGCVLTDFGSARVLDRLSGEQLPRIC